MSQSSRMIDVAKLAGVSVMTVSRVLSEHPSVSSKAREKVLSAVAHLRYQPNEVARSLREKRSRQIGILVPDLYDPFFAVCAHTVSTVAQEHSYSILLSTSNEDSRAEFDEINRMLRRNVEGLVVIPARLGENRSLLLGSEFRDLPIVALDRPIEGSRFDAIVVENEKGAREGTDHLLGLGHKRILFLGLSKDLYTMRMRELGYRNGMQAAGLIPQTAELSGNIENTRSTLRQLLSGKNRPTALFCANNLLTRRVLHALQSMDIHPPDMVALVGFDDFDTADLLHSGITTVRQPVESLGRMAAEMLFEWITAEVSAVERPAKQIMLPVELVLRGSCGAKVYGVSRDGVAREKQIRFGSDKQ